MKKLALLLILCATTGMQSYGKGDLKPKWCGNVPAANSKFYFVEVTTDAASSLSGARTYVLKDLASNVERTDNVNVTECYEDNSSQQYKGGQVDFSGSDSYQLKLNVEGSAQPILSRRIDEYWVGTQRGNIDVLEYSALYAVARKGAKPDFSSIRITSSYGVHGLWRSMIVPGWGQMHKGSYAKGGVILGGTVALAGGIIFTESMRQTCLAQISQTHSSTVIKQLYANMSNWAIGRNVCIGAAAALYAYNIVDAIVAPGARRVVVTPGYMAVRF